MPLVSVWEWEAELPSVLAWEVELLLVSLLAWELEFHSLAAYSFVRQ